MRTFLRMLLLSAVLLAGCGVGGDRAATVNGTDISRSLLERVVQAELDAVEQPLEDAELASATDEIQRNLLTILIHQRIMADLAAAHDVEPSDEEVDEALAETIEDGGGDEAFGAFLADIGLTVDEYREIVVVDSLRREALIDSLLTDVSDADLRELYELQRETRYETRTARHILVETEAEADEVLLDLAAGEDFATLAEERSQDPGSSIQGGDLGPQARGAYVGPFDEAVWGAQIGEVVGPVETDFGFHVIEVTDETMQSFADAEEQLRAELEAGQTGEAFEALVADAVEAADVRVAPGLGQWDASSGRVVALDRVGDGPSSPQVPTPDPEPPVVEE